jgi:hypothetical protein
MSKLDQIQSELSEVKSLLILLTKQKKESPKKVTVSDYQKRFKESRTKK